jgi:hypothetical protein
MSTLIALDDQAETALPLIVASLPGDGLVRISLALAKFADDVRCRLHGITPLGLDLASIEALDWFVATPNGRVLVDTRQFWFIAERGVQDAAILVTDIVAYPQGE